MSNYELQIDPEKKQWENFIATSPQNNLFCTIQFLDAWGKNYELLLVTKNQDIQLGAVVVKQDDGQRGVAAGRAGPAMRLMAGERRGT